MLVIQKLRDTAAKDGKGFVEFGWNDPATGKEGRKLGYVVKVDESMWLGSGIYLKSQAGDIRPKDAEVAEKK